MDGYREFWNTLIFGNEFIGPESLERYWATMALVAAIFFAVGIASVRLRFLAPAATALLFTAYIVAIVPFMVWSASCTKCGASSSYDSARSLELAFIHLYWTGVFTMGVTTLWLGVLLSRGVAAMIEWRAMNSGAPPEPPVA